MEKPENTGDVQVRTMDSANLDEMLQKSFWKDILYEIISALDPWDIDIAELATRYAGNVEQMEEMNFKIPANVVIVSSVLLRMKSQMMCFTDANYDPTGEEWMEDYGVVPEGADFIMGPGTETPGSNGGETGDELPNLEVRPKRVPKRRLTALELISAIQEVLDDRVVREKIRETNRAKGDRKLVIPMTIDIRQLIEKTYGMVMEILSKKEEAMFSEIAQGRDEIISTFISLLHLSNTQRLTLRQEKMFDEIYIHQ